MDQPPFPLQPLYRDESDVVRFRENRIVRYLLDHGGLDLNRLMVIGRRHQGFTDADWAQLAQLIGYSLAGFHELSYVRDADALRASAAAREAGLLTEGGGCRDGEGCPIHSDAAQDEEAE